MQPKRERYTPTDVGPIPREWDAPRLSSAASLITNGFVGTATPYYVKSGGVAYLYGTNIRPNRIDLTDLRFISEEFHEQESKTALAAGDVLMVQSGHIGTTAVVPPTLEGANCHALILTRPIKSKLDSYFLSYYLNSHIGKARLRGLEVGSTILHINTKDLKKFRIPLPDLDEQKAIAQSIHCWTEAEETAQRLLLQARQQKKALAQQLLTGKRRLTGFSGEWKTFELGSVCERVKDKNQICDTNVLTISGIRGLVSQTDYFSKQIASESLVAYTRLLKGDFAYNKSYSSGYSMGAIKRLNDYASGVVSGLYICFRLRLDSRASANFLEHYFEAGRMNREIYSIAQEGARNHGLLNMPTGDFFKCRVLLPEPDEQNVIVRVLDLADELIRGYESLLDNLELEKRALMQQLLTGKKRLPIPADAKSEPAEEQA